MARSGGEGGREAEPEDGGEQHQVVSGFGFRVSGLGFRVSSLLVYGCAFCREDADKEGRTSLRVQGLGVLVWEEGVLCLGFRV